jgi:hypothetical protein
VVVVVVVVAATPNYLRQASQNLGKYLQAYFYSLLLTGVRHHSFARADPVAGFSLITL